MSQTCTAPLTSVKSFHRGLVLLPFLLLTLTASTTVVLPLPFVQQRLQPGYNHRQEGFGGQLRLVCVLPLLRPLSPPIRGPVSLPGRLLWAGGLRLAEQHSRAPVDRTCHLCWCFALQQRARRSVVGVAIEVRHRREQLRDLCVRVGALAARLGLAVWSGVDGLEGGRLGVGVRMDEGGDGVRELQFGRKRLVSCWRRRRKVGFLSLRPLIIHAVTTADARRIIHPVSAVSVITFPFLFVPVPHGSREIKYNALHGETIWERTEKGSSEQPSDPLCSPGR